MSQYISGLCWIGLSKTSQTFLHLDSRTIWGEYDISWQPQDLFFQILQLKSTQWLNLTIKSAVIWNLCFFIIILGALSVLTDRLVSNLLSALLVWPEFDSQLEVLCRSHSPLSLPHAFLSKSVLSNKGTKRPKTLL